MDESSIPSRLRTTDWTAASRLEKKKKEEEEEAAP